jgi:hypothetical protein
VEALRGYHVLMTKTLIFAICSCNVWEIDPMLPTIPCGSCGVKVMRLNNMCTRADAEAILAEDHGATPWE